MFQHYDAAIDNIGSWNDAIAAIRARHRALVRTILPELRIRRYARHLSVDQLAPMIGVSPSCLSMWEAGHHIPAPDLFSRWRDLLGC